jgi:hypothetical protein
MAREHTGLGKWQKAGVPKKGWTWLDVEPLDEPSETCEMCETVEIRYVHLMEHPNYPDVLRVGCVCAERMSEDYARPRARERALQNRSQRKSRWLLRRWRESKRGNSYLKTNGFFIVIHRNSDGSWGGTVTDVRSGSEPRRSKRKYPTYDAAALAAFDAMEIMASRRV